MTKTKKHPHPITPKNPRGAGRPPSGKEKLPVTLKISKETNNWLDDIKGFGSIAAHIAGVVEQAKAEGKDPSVYWESGTTERRSSTLWLEPETKEWLLTSSNRSRFVSNLLET